VLVHVPPAHEPHATRHNKVRGLLESHVGAELQVATHMLTRASETSDFAPDVSVYPQARDPHTGGRQLEQLAFEICAGESLSHAARKAGKLTERGVRRVFAIDVEHQRVLEWSCELQLWRFLDSDGTIEDPALAAPVPVRALLDVARIDDELVPAPVTKDTRALETAIADHVRHAKAHAIITFLTARGVPLEETVGKRMFAEPDLARLDRWIERAASCGSISELLAAP